MLTRGCAAPARPGAVRRPPGGGAGSSTAPSGLSGEPLLGHQSSLVGRHLPRACGRRPPARPRQRHPAVRHSVRRRATETPPGDPTRPSPAHPDACPAGRHAAAQMYMSGSSESPLGPCRCTRRGLFSLFTCPPGEHHQRRPAVQTARLYSGVYQAKRCSRVQRGVHAGVHAAGPAVQLGRPGGRTRCADDRPSGRIRCTPTHTITCPQLARGGVSPAAVNSAAGSPATVIPTSAVSWSSRARRSVSLAPSARAAASSSTTAARASLNRRATRLQLRPPGSPPA